MYEDAFPYLKKEEHAASYFLEIWYDDSGKPDDETEFGEKSPTALDTEKSSRGFSLVGPDRLSVSYPHVSKHAHDVGVVQANRAAPWKRLAYYFEIFVKNAGAEGRISLGFTTSSFKLRHHPGWDADSCGYSGINGMLYRGPEQRETFGPTYTTGDTVGCGINNATQQFFFTKNGVLIGITKKDMEGPVFPTIGVHSKNEEVIVNFGKKPFLFDLRGYEEDHRAGLKKTIDEIEIARDIRYGIVRSYLQHYGYEESLRLFDMESVVPPIYMVQENRSNEEDMYALNQRWMIRQMIMRGQVDDAFTKLKEWFPQIMEDDVSTICFFLQSQKFVELVRDGKLSEAIVLGRSEFDKFRRVLMVEDQVKDCASLLAYKQPCESYVGYLLKESHRELVADAVNATILSMNPNVKDEKFSMQSPLERLIRQLTTCFLEHRWSLNGDQGEAFDLHRILESHKK